MKIVQKIFLSFIYFFLYFPLLVLVIYSVNDVKFSLQWHGWSWRWYLELFQDHNLWLAFSHSIILGLASALLATLSGFFVCAHLFIYRGHYNTILNSLLIILIIIPDLVFGVSLLIFFNFMQIPLGFISLFIAHSTFCLPFAIITIYARIKELDVNIYFSALDLGATKIYALRKILLPLMWPAVFSAFLLSFTLSFDDVIISYFVAGPDFNILPLTIYSLIRAGITPEINALCTITIMFTMGLIFIAYRFIGRVPLQQL